jgi:SAM-dependent methyltransferase
VGDRSALTFPGRATFPGKENTTMDDPVRRHPTRAEQLDILASLVAARTLDGDRVLDLGCGPGYVAHLILEKRPALSIVGIDRNAKALTQAEINLAPYASDFTAVIGDLEDIAGIDAPAGPFRVIYTALTFHDLPGTAKQAVIGWAAAQLAPGGYFLLYDRLRLCAPGLFELQRDIWSRIEQVHGVAMRDAPDYDGYIADLADNNRPGSLDDYTHWFADAGLAMQVLHLHGNVALIGGARR